MVLVLEGKTTVVLLTQTGQSRINLASGEMIVVPANIWHKFDDSDDLKVLTITPQPTDHSLVDPEYDRQ